MVTFPKGTEITAYVNGDFSIEPARAISAAAPPDVIPQSPPATAETATLVIVSVPEGSDITVNGKYAGNTPSTLQLPPGDYVVAIEQSSFEPWKRTISLIAGSDITISATLDNSAP